MIDLPLSKVVSPDGQHVVFYATLPARSEQGSVQLAAVAKPPVVEPVTATRSIEQIGDTEHHAALVRIIDGNGRVLASAWELP